ncbi:serine/threonine protein kinase [Gordonia westfalica]|uniref:non-specific serine/threonine protein kinase n=1 Tax=Gordonia westfalica TaxID=158898 RepID=A0A1H2JJG7_9ACTN|nr:serine/threonine protein kinase [Gordonia westfalica]SDU56590.1 serine/threonine protein kinase [Gordonia westfalica]
MSFDATHGDSPAPGSVRAGRVVPGSVVAGHRIERVLHESGIGITCRAVPITSTSPAPGMPGPEPVVLTVVDPAPSADPRFRSRFARANESASGIRHPAIARIVGHGVSDGLLWVATAPVPTTDAAELIRRHPDGTDIDLAVRIVAAVGEALDAAHSRRLVHGGVTTSDILISAASSEITASAIAGPGAVTLRGFGLSPPADGEETPHPDADVAALGRILVELLTGTTSVARHRVSGAVSPAFYAVLARALDPQPDHRYRTCAEFVRAADLALHLTHTDGEPPTEVISSSPRVFRPTGSPDRPTEIVAGHRPGRPQHALGGSRSSRGADTRPRRRTVAPLLVALVVVAVCVGTVIVLGARNAPTPWPATVAPIAEAFPRLLPDSPDHQGWRDASCQAMFREGLDAISCSDAEQVTYVVWHTATPGARDTVTAPLKGFPGDEIRWRDGPASSSRDSLADGWVVTNFAEPVRAPYTVIATWPGHSGRQILDGWWRTAPLG